MLKPAPGRLPGSAEGLPAMSNGMPKPVPCTGIPVDTETAVTPGTAWTRSRSCA